jgi:hypothetical protein
MFIMMNFFQGMETGVTCVKKWSVKKGRPQRGSNGKYNKGLNKVVPRKNHHPVGSSHQQMIDPERL